MSTLEATLGQDAPACLDEIWNNGVLGFSTKEQKEAIILLAQSFVGANMALKNAKSAIKKWAKDYCSLNTSLIENEIERVYNDNQVFECGPTKDVGVIRKRELCDPDGCLFTGFSHVEEETEYESSGNCGKEESNEPVRHEVPQEIKERAKAILSNEGLVVARRNLIAKKHFGDIPAIDLQTYCGMSTYLSDPLHSDINGIPEIGKSDSMIQSLMLFPDEDVIMYTEISAKHMYYESLETSFENKIVYLDDVRVEHIGLLKSMRNETEITGRLGTVVDGVAVNIVLSGHPVVFASSVQPLRDIGGQGTSRAFLIPMEKPTTLVEKKVRDKIRRKIERRGLDQILRSQGNSEEEKEKLAIQEAERFLRDEGVKRVSIPFDAEEPEDSGRRDTGKFVKLIAVSAFIHQLQRPVMHIGSDKVVLAIQADLFNALDIYHGLGIAHELRITPNGLKILKVLPDKEEHAIGIREIVIATGLKDRTANDNLTDLYSGDLVNKKQILAPGNPFVYWIDTELSERVNAEISTPGKGQTDLSGFKRKSGSLKYGHKYSSDWLKTSIYSFFNELSGIDRDRERDIDIKLEYYGFVFEKKDILFAYLEIFSAEIKKESNDSDYLSECQSAESAEIPLDSDIGNPLKSAIVDFGPYEDGWEPADGCYA